ncbi:MAG: HAD-IB family hydrolase [Polyangia bacterium]|jgi:HAD superfamily hydrolase (TIGR01490 family)|nr:HAD-IB family hydrolase [Polyangia bacterium]
MGTAFFDVDGTLIQGSTGMLALETFRRAGYISYFSSVQALGYHVLHRAGVMDAREVYRKAMAPFVGRPVEEVAVHVENLYREAVRPAIYQRAVELAEEHHRRGDRVVLLSASSALLLERFRDVMPVDHILAFVQKSEEGRYISAYEEPVPYGAGKLALAEAYLAAEGGTMAEATCYADSISDLPLLEAAGTPRPTNPDLRLRRVAEKRAWPTLQFYRVLGRGFDPVDLEQVPLLGEHGDLLRQEEPPRAGWGQGGPREEARGLRPERAAHRRR